MLDTDRKAKAGGDLKGTAYGRGAQHPNALLTGVKAGTPGGEWLRRYWQPIALSAEVTNRPRKVKLLGEELIIFRDGHGKVGLLYPRCMHRGTSLYYGRVEENGIRCCYHGWLFDTEGNCLEQPCEPEGGLRKDAARQPWYPTEERYGLVFAYMGPPDRMPVLPRYDILENLEEGEFIAAWGGDGGIAYVDSAVTVESAPYHWLQAYENVMDPFHVNILHAWFTPEQIEDYKREPKVTPRDMPAPVPPTIEFERHGLGAVYRNYLDRDDGRPMLRTQYAVLPNIGAIAAVDLTEGPATNLAWYVATDDENMVVFAVSKTREPTVGFAMPMTPDGRPWSEMTEDEHQDYPGDFEAQFGQGRTTLHSEEHLAQSDVGVVILRRVMAEQIKAVEAGEDPLGVAFDDAGATVEIVAGNAFR